jgi:hypothetical protein
LIAVAENTKPRILAESEASKGVGTGQGSNGFNDTPTLASAPEPPDCPRYQRCGAPVCPLDPDWRHRKHLDGESVCGLLLELAKDGGEATLRTCLPEEVAVVAITLAPAIRAAHGPVRRACEKAARSGSRLRNFAAQRAGWTGESDVG